MATCRVCGASVSQDELQSVLSGGGCSHCNGSPACARCGHPRRHHRGAFGAGEARCEVKVPVAGTVATGRCGCPGYTRDPASYAEPTPLAEVTAPRLRLAGDRGGVS